MDFGTHIPQKKNFKFNEISSLTEVKPYVLRFWESEFDQISPLINEAGQKLYDTSDLLVVKLIKKLLFEDKLSIPEVKKVIDDELKTLEIASSDLFNLEKECEQTISLNAPSELATNNEIETTGLRARQRDLSSSFNENTILASKARPFSDHIKKEDLLESPQSQAALAVSTLNDKHVVKLVCAKKKLYSLLEKISQIEENHRWN